MGKPHTETKVHYVGATRVEHGAGVTTRAAGWPSCGTGIKRDRETNTFYTIGQMSDNENQVTCKKCLAIMRKAGVL